jgi:hypothetical protein
MQTYRVHDKAVVLILTRREARALGVRLEQRRGIKKSQALLSAESKLRNALWCAGLLEVEPCKP